MSKQAVIIGYSGHAFVVLDVLTANKYSLAGYCDITKKIKNPYGLSYLGTEQDEQVIRRIENFDAFLGIGDNFVRSAIYKKLCRNKINFPALLHPAAITSMHLSIGRGTVVMAGAVVNAMTKLGDAVICNTSSVIEHECTINNYAHIAPGAVLAGNVTIGEYSFIGANAVIKQGINIGSNVIIGAGSVVTKDIPNGVTVYGNPAKKSEK